MAEGADMNYVATRIIDYPPDSGNRAYNPGDLVHVSAVEGDGAWLRAGVDVRPRAGTHLDRPAGNATTQAWADYAVACGLLRTIADEMSRDELKAKYSEPAPAPAVEPAPPAPPAEEAAP